MGKVLRAGVAGLAACALAGIVVPATASSAVLRSDRTMVVFFKDPGVGARFAPARTADTAVLNQVTQLGAAVLERDTAIGAATVRLTPAQAAALAADPLVKSVLPNTRVPGPTLPVVRHARSGSSHGTPANASCGTAASPQLNPEALGNINAEANEGYNGAGVKVAFIADGLNPSNPDLLRNPAFASAGSLSGSHVVTYVNFSGDSSNGSTGGAEAFGDAGSIAAQGNTTYNLSSFVGTSHPLAAGCDIRIEGDAPGASVLGLNVFGNGNFAYASSMVQAINYAVAHGASVINESFGFNNFPDTSEDIIRQADDAAVAAGVTVVVSSGDSGPDNTIGSPASDPNVLAVGATTQYRAYAQFTYGGINALSSHAGYLDNNISAFSSGGIAQDGKTVSLVAPGDLGWSLCSPSIQYGECSGLDLQLFGGTSESAPLTSGAAADVIEAYEATHGGSAPSPQLVMEILTSTAVDTSAPAVQQGAGLLDVGAAIQLATSEPGTTLVSPPGGVQSDTTQVNLSGNPSSPQSASIQFTNTSTSPTTVDLSTRTLQPSGAASGTVTLNCAKNSKDPTFKDEFGDVNVEEKVTVAVPAGTARVRLQAAFAPSGGALFDTIGVSLFAPNGDLAAYSIPQGFSNFADVEASAPQAGTWTAVFFEQRSSGSNLSTQVHWVATDFVAATEGSMSQSSVTLAAGESQGVELNVTMPATPGDTGFAVVVDAGSHVTTIPVTLRTDIPLTASGGTFSGVLTGGNGRGGAPAQSNTYSLVVPPGERDLDVAVAMASNPTTKSLTTNDEFGAFLVDPDGATRAYNENAQLDNKAAEGIDFSKDCNLYVASPLAGSWLLVLDWFQPLSGAATSIQFAGSIKFDTVSASSNLPDSATSTIPKAGEKFVIQVHNTGNAKMELSEDARLSTETSLSVPNLFGGAIQNFPTVYAGYYLPIATQMVQFKQTTTVPATFQAQSLAGDPLLGPTTASAFVTESYSPKSSDVDYSPPGGVIPGDWELVSDQVGPYPASGAPKGHAILDVHVEASAFDTSVTSTVPDIVKDIFTEGDQKALPSELGVVPGATGTIPITITPKLPTGTVVTGTIYVDEAWPELTPEVLVAIPYEYTVGS
jgi:hypothetical protein